jgi:resuscitation-promoting factor RpfA
MAHDATRAQQIVVAENVLAGQGWKLPTSDWPPPPRPPPPSPPLLRAPRQAARLVEPGDTLSGIATTRNIAGGWLAIVVNNPGLTSPNLIHTGQRLIL